MPDAADDVGEVFQYVRPTLVVGEATTADALPKNVVVEHAIGQVSGMTIEVLLDSCRQNHFQTGTHKMTPPPENRAKVSLCVEKL